MPRCRYWRSGTTTRSRTTGGRAACSTRAAIPTAARCCWRRAPDGPGHGDGPPVGRELGLADLLSTLKRAGVGNTVWLTADMHYTAAHYYDPNRAVFSDFTPFWEFVSGPLHAGSWGPAALDNTFGPQLRYQKGCTAEQGENLAPCFGLQFFGRVDIEGRTGVMTVTLKDVDDTNLWSVDLPPAGEASRKLAERR